MLITCKGVADPTIYSGSVLGQSFEILSEGMSNEMKNKFKKIREDQENQAKEFEKLTPEQRRKRYENDFKTLTAEDKALLEVVKNNQYKEFNNRSFNCPIRNNLKGLIVFKEEILVAHNFKERSQVFDNYKHLIGRREADINAAYSKMFDVEKIDQKEEYKIVGCKKKRDFDLSDNYLLLEGEKSKLIYMLELTKFEEMKTEISNDYDNFLKALERKDYAAVKDKIGKIDFLLIKIKAINMLIMLNDEQMVDIFKEANVIDAELFISALSSTKNENLYLKVYPLLAKERRPLFFASAFTRGYSSKVINLYSDLRKGDIDQKYYPGLIYQACTANNSKELLNILLNKGFNLKETDEAGTNVLHYIAQFGHSENDEKCVDYLLGAGHDINAADKDGNTPLHRASSVYNKKRIAFFIAKGASTQIVNKAGKPALK